MRLVLHTTVPAVSSVPSALISPSLTAHFAMSVDVFHPFQMWQALACQLVFVYCWLARAVDRYARRRWTFIPLLVAHYHGQLVSFEAHSESNSVLGMNLLAMII